MTRKEFLRMTALSGAILLRADTPVQKDDGYRGIWYFNQPSHDKYVYKYSGGFATYPQQQMPIAIHVRKVNKTFFVYGGTTKGTDSQLLHMVSFYDHVTKEVPRPTILLNKQTSDAHDNPTLSIDDDGYLWVFSSAHGTARPSFLHRSRKPYSIDEFDSVLTTNFSYTEPWYFSGSGFLLLHTRYQKLTGKGGSGRALYWMTSLDGWKWGEPKLLAFALQGHYQISWPNGHRLGTAFNVHPLPLGLNQRTNLYYLETADMGRSWRRVSGEAVETPITTAENPALVKDYRSEGLLVYLKDIQYDHRGHPVILHLTSKGYESGPRSGPRMLRTAHWRENDWEFRDVVQVDHNYDHGSLYLEADGTWRLIAPTAPGPEPYGTGGEVELWLSRDEGRTWRKQREVTQHSRYNHTYVRRPLHAHEEFYAFWADGNAFAPSESRLYFCDRSGEHVYRLPSEMKSDFAKPNPVR